MGAAALHKWADPRERSLVTPTVSPNKPVPYLQVDLSEPGHCVCEAVEVDALVAHQTQHVGLGPRRAKVEPPERGTVGDVEVP